MSFQLVDDDGETRGRAAVVNGINADSGTQACVMPLEQFSASGLPRSAPDGSRIFAADSFGRGRVHP